MIHKKRSVVKPKKVIDSFVDPIVAIRPAVTMGPICHVEGCVNPLAPGQNQVCRAHIKAN
jgi:hypothetical protein